MSSLLSEIFFDITKFLPNDDITDLMLLSRKFNALVVPRLQKIDQEMSTMNQSIKSFMPSPAPEPTDNEWISQLNLKRFEPIGSKAKKLMRKAFMNQVVIQYCLVNVEDSDAQTWMLQKLKKEMFLERFDDPSFLRIFGALIATPKFRQEYNVSRKLLRYIEMFYIQLAMRNIYPNDSFVDMLQILSFYKNQ
ncbi:hypothetical protein Ddc_17926 [Ditylenchus destructor]|nr:hypothetical protein Ddc_17926 [Ditylenchus destructor]